MEEVESTGGHLSQRALAKRLNISLGLANSFIKRLLEKGYFKATTIPRNRLRYALTPQGLAEKYRLTRDYLRYSMNLYAHIRRMLQLTVENLREKNITEVALWGRGETAELAYMFVSQYGIKVSGIYHPHAEGESILGHPVRPPHELANSGARHVLLATMENTKQPRRILGGMGIGPEKIYELLDGPLLEGDDA